MPAAAAIHRLLRRAGIDVVRADSVDVAGLRRYELRRRSLGLVIDVGANVGQFAVALRAVGYPGRIVSFEPASEAFAHLEREASTDPHWDVSRTALSGSSDQATLHLAANSWSSSLLPIGERHTASAPGSEPAGNETVQTRTLDELHDELFRGERAYLKLDVQGSELAVLTGAEQTLQDVDIVEAELSLVELYDGQPLLLEVVAYLDERGFALVRVEPEFTHPRTGAILQLNGIFVRPIAP